MKVFDNRIDEIQGTTGEYFIYLRNGLQINKDSYETPQHCFGADSKRDVSDQLQGVSECDCNECVTT